ncbi:MAG: hypothetical protein AAGC55_15805 [Myxococcota bacterium]
MSKVSTCSGRIVAILMLGAIGLIAWPGQASAKSQRVVSYSFEQVWPTALRFLRIDEGLEIIERDAEAGYVMFELSEENKRFRGALELVRVTDDEGRSAVRLLLRIEDRPSYMELGILSRLERKLREELGAPRDPPPPQRPAGDEDGKKDANDKSKTAGGR